MTSGILLLDKPVGPTSHDAVARVRRAGGLRRVGHAGTLDPLADGLLVLGLGPAARFLEYLVGLDKTYETTVRLGQATTCLLYTSPSPRDRTRSRMPSSA